MNIIAAITSTGQLMYTVNCGHTNSFTFGYFLLKLVAHLDAECMSWRKTTVLMMDNASYHRGPHTRSLMDRLRVPVLFMGPYHFRVAPIEMVFNFIKAHDLNPLRSKTSGR